MSDGEVRVMVRGARWIAVVLVVLAGLATGAAWRPDSDGAEAAGALACQTFPETGFQVCDPFLTYWRDNGGLAQQGYPISAEFDEANPTDGKTYRTQYFERARFEYHPEQADPRYQVLLGLLGREQYLAKYPGGRPPTNLEGRPDYCFVQTQRCVGDAFLAYWRANGGLAQQGLPLSDEFAEVSPTDGKTYAVQYFERARFEYHPENVGTPYVVLLGLLGREQFQAKYPNGVPTGGGSPAPVASPIPSPVVPPPSAAPAATATPTATPTRVPPTPTPTTAPNPRAGCDPSYPTVCIPPPPPDLDCKDIPYKRFPVNTPDPHRFDSDNDGIGCES